MAGSLIHGQPLPRGNDALIRRIEKLERDMRELAPSIAKSFQTTVARAAEQVSTYSFTHEVDKDSADSPVAWSIAAPAWARAAYVEAFAENVTNTLVDTDIYVLVGFSSPAWASGLIEYTSLDVNIGASVGPLVPTAQASRVIPVREGSADGSLHGLLEAYPSTSPSSAGAALVRITQIIIWIP